MTMNGITANDILGLAHVGLCLVSPIVMVYWLLPLYHLRNHLFFVKRRTNLSIYVCVLCILGQIFDRAAWAVYYSEFSFFPAVVSRYAFWMSTLTYPWFMYGILFGVLLRCE